MGSGGEMKINGKEEDALKAPLLKPSENVAITVVPAKGDKKVRTVKFKIGEIKCTSCSTSIESMLGEVNGVESAVISPLDGRAAITYVPELVDVNKIKETIEDAGFPVEEFPEHDIEVCRLRIKGMMCTSCSESVERALLSAVGVKKAVVGLALEEAKVHFDPNRIDTDGILKVVEDAGFWS
ncbi:hypothetical protein OIU78_009215 [Salix suchowensis]|nr:hypothetical protein OIU78_009215 [Salix suchowensis]